jgi:hypothetical protein
MNDQQMLLLERFVIAMEGQEQSIKNMENLLGRFLSRPDSLEMLEKAKAVVSVKEAVSSDAKVKKSSSASTVAQTSKTQPTYETKETDPADIQAGIRVLIVTDDAKDGVVGTCVSRNVAWAKVSVEVGNDTYDKGETLAIRPQSCKILVGEENPTDEQLEEVASEIPEIYSQPSDGDHPGNSRFDKGTYVGQTVHEVFEDRGDMAIKFFKFVSKSPVYKGTEYAKAVVEYCKLRGVDLAE